MHEWHRHDRQRVNRSWDDMVINERMSWASRPNWRAPAWFVIVKIYPFQYIWTSMKSLHFLGDSLERLREFPEDARHDVGYQLDKVQRGERPDDAKPMPTIGKGVEEIRVWDDAGTFRVVYTARLGRCGVCVACISEEDPDDVQTGSGFGAGLLCRNHEG